MKSRPTQLIDIVRKTFEILGKTFTVDWIDAPKSEDDGVISSELRKEAKRIVNAGVLGKEVE